MPRQPHPLQFSCNATLIEVGCSTLIWLGLTCSALVVVQCDALQLLGCELCPCNIFFIALLSCSKLICNTVSALGCGVIAMINNNIHWECGGGCNAVGCNGLHSSLLQTPCHALSAQGSAPNTRFRNTRVCHCPQENGNVFLSMENYISAKATRG